MQYKPLARLLAESEVVFTCLNKNVLLLGRKSLPGWVRERCCSTLPSAPALIPLPWKHGWTSPALIISVTPAPQPPVAEGFFERPNVHCANVSAAAPSRPLCC